MEGGGEFEGALGEDGFAWTEDEGILVGGWFGLDEEGSSGWGRIESGRVVGEEPSQIEEGPHCALAGPSSLCLRHIEGDRVMLSHPDSGHEVKYHR